MPALAKCQHCLNAGRAAADDGDFLFNGSLGYTAVFKFENHAQVRVDCAVKGTRREQAAGAGVAAQAGPAALRTA